MLCARVHRSLDEIDATAWDALIPDQNPFVRHAFLAGLECTGCIDPRHGWQPHHLGLYDDARLIAAAPLYLKGNSHGEFVFDWAWAGAYERHDLAYYPKLLCAVPYSPVTGPRLLVGADDDGADARRRALIEAITTLAQRSGLSSAHLNFATPDDAAAFPGRDWLPRFDWQFHWIDRGWRDFADFLDALSHRKRKNVRQERARVTRAGIACEIRRGDEMTATDWRALHRYYLSTFADKGNYPALTEAFFRHLGAALPRQVLAVLCRRDQRLVAAALLLRSSNTLYGRYWGADEEIPGLHFEACYYQGIEYCLREGLQRFEPGAQGEHKLSRGFLPAMTRSFHWIADPRFRAAIGEALAHEARVLHAYHDDLMRHSPYAHVRAASMVLARASACASDGADSGT